MSKKIAYLGISITALTMAACGSSQGAQVLTVPTTRAPLHHVDGLYVGNYKGNDRQTIVAAKKETDLASTLAFEMLSKQSSTTAIAATESQLKLYASAGIYKYLVSSWTTAANSGDTATLAKGTAPTTGIDNASVMVTPNPHNPKELDVTGCGYNNIQETGQPGNTGEAGFASETVGTLKVNNRWVVIEILSSKMVPACPAN